MHIAASAPPVYFPISLIPGARLGSYEIVGALGAGGMGEVYRARDTKLNRDVAIKVLLPAVANDADRLARFRREAQVLASLNHPNIAHIHGLDETGGITALILEFVDGEDLAQRISRGPMPLDEVLPIARQIAEALSAAHDHGIIHRDLKPANIKVRADGTVKVLDFGLAKAIDPTAGSRESVMNSPTLSNHATAAGSILGTAAYMSPEQASGKSVDKRSDLWAFGVVLFEMLTARRTFAGETTSHVLASVLKDEPDWALLPADTPAPVRRLLRRCLQKDRTLRLADAADARLEITEAATEHPDVSQVRAVPVRAVRRRELIAWSLAAILALAAWASAMRPTMLATDTATMRFSLAPPGGSTFYSGSGGGGGWGSPLVVSPDGQRIVLVLVDAAGRQRLWLRTLDTTTPQLLPGTEGATGPFWSPDSRWIAFFAQGKLKRIPSTGGDVQILCDSGRGGGGTWNRDDVIVFAAASAGEGGLARVPAGGGTPQPLTTLDAARGETNHSWPQFLPDGRHYIYVIGGDASGLYVGQLDSTARDMVLDSNDLGRELSRVEYAAPGYLLFVRNRALMAQRFDAASLTATGEVVQVADNVLKEGPGSSAFSASGNGVLAYWSGAVPPDSQLTWLGRDGTPAGIVGPPAGYFAVALAPDERTVAVSRFEINEISLKVALWLIDVPRNTSTKFTFGTGADHPVWSRDGARIAFSTPQGGPPTVFQKRADTVGGDERLLRSVASTRPTDWSADGATLIYQSLDSVSRWDLWLKAGAGSNAPMAFLRTSSNETDARISPDGRWAAYVSDESGAREVYVTGFPKALGKWPISTTGGHAPEWRRDGKELYYVSANGKLMAVPVTVGGAAIDAGAPAPLFAMPVVAATATGYGDAQFAASNDGRRFLVRVPIGETSVLPATVMVNWSTGIRK